MLSRNEASRHCASSGSRRLRGRIGTSAALCERSKHAEPVRAETPLAVALAGEAEVLSSHG